MLLRDSRPRAFVGLLGWRIVCRVCGIVAVVVCVGASAVLLGACGGGASKGASVRALGVPRSAGVGTTALAGGAGVAGAVRLPHGVAAVVGRHVISSAMLSEWMVEQVGETYYLAATHKAPPRLVSEPADYPACVASLKRVAPYPGEKPPVALQSAAQLRARCEALYEAIKRDTLDYLVRSYLGIDFAAAHGIAFTDAEVQQGLQRYKREHYPKPGEFEHVLATRTRTLAQELFILKNDLIQQKILPKLLAGPSSRLYKEALHDPTTATCPPGFLVEHCYGHKPTSPRPDGVSAAVMLEEIARWRPQTSHGRTGQPVK
jgi:hypothetical protein